MTKLAPFMVSKKLTETAKMYIVLRHLGGKATTGEIKQCGSANGARNASGWNVAATFNGGGDRVARLNDGWLLLPVGESYVESHGYVEEPLPPTASTKTSPADGSIQIVIGHGRSRVWRDLKEWLRDNYDCKVHEFNSQSVVGRANKEILLDLIQKGNVAFVVMTAEDETGDGAKRARQNVIHEVGLFQGALGFENAAILLEEGCAEFSNIAGLGQIRFPLGDISPAFEAIRQYMRDQHGLTA